LVPIEFEEYLIEADRISEDTVWENRVIELKPFLTIENGATLTVRNCQLVAKPPGAQKEISVGFGSSLFIYDSFLGGDGINTYITLSTEPGASLIIKDSEIHYAGRWGGAPGIYLMGDGAIIANNEMMGIYDVKIEGSSHHRIVNNKIWDCVYGISGWGDSFGTVVEGNEVWGCVEDIFQEQVLKQ